MSDSAEGATEERRSLLVPDVPRWLPGEGPVMRLDGVHKAFDDEPLFEGLDLVVEPGLSTVVIGQSGSGKSVLLKMLIGLQRPDQGEVQLFGHKLSELSELHLLRLRKRCSMVFQNYALLDSLNVFDNIAFPLRENTSIQPAEQKERVDELLDLFELAHAGTKLPSELSGGMRKRVSLARALITHPEVVLFDEPTTGLDPVMIEFVDGMIRKAQERFRITSVIISHDMGSVFNLADRLAMLDGGRIVAYGTIDDLRNVQHDTLQAFLSAGGSGRLTAGKPASEEEGAAQKSAASPLSIHGEGGLGGVRLGEAEATGMRSGEEVPAGTSSQEEPEPAVIVKDLHKSFGPHKVLEGVDLTIPRGLITMVIGGSGSGKSVLIKHITGLFQPDRGSIRLFGKELTELGSEERAQLRTRIGFLFQGAALFDSMTIAENVAFPLVEQRIAKGKELKRRVDEMLERIHIPDLADRYPGDISAGERKRAGLGRALITQPEILIYDEPTTGQDPIMIRSVDEMIQETWEQFRITSIVISHDMQSTFRIGHRIAMVHSGRIRVFGRPADLLASEDPEVRKFVFAGSKGG